MRDADGEVQNLSETELTTTPLTDKALYVTNAWYADASRKEIKADLHEILSLARESDERVNELSLQYQSFLLGPKAAKRKAINREASATEKASLRETVHGGQIKGVSVLVSGK